MPLTTRQQNHWAAARIKLLQLGHDDPETFAQKMVRARKLKANYRTVEKIILEVIKEVRANLALRLVYPGRTVLEYAVFNALRDGSQDPVAEIVDAVVARGLDKPGVLIYPLFGFGLLHERTASLLSANPTVEMIDNVGGLAATSQLGSEAAVLAFFARAAAGLDVVGKLPERELHHWLRGRGVTTWLLTNPLLVVRVRSISMSSHDNRSVHFRIMAHRAAFLALSSTLMNPRDASRMLSGSTHSRNNSETLDVRHYFVLESSGDPNLPLRTDRISMNFGRGALMQLADLAVDVDPSAWTHQKAARRIAALTSALLDLEDLQAAVDGAVATAALKANMSRKLSTALHWARRSFASFSDPREQAVALAVAYEALLSDGYARGITDTIISRARACIGAQRGAESLGEAVAGLFDLRGAIVHKGEARREITLLLARRAFVLCFIDTVKRTLAAKPSNTLRAAQLFVD